MNYFASTTSIPDLLGSDSSYNGKGIRICFIDTGIYLHPDLTNPHNRIVLEGLVGHRRTTNN